MEALSEGAVVGSPLQRALLWEALPEGAVAGGPRRGLRDGLDPPHGYLIIPLFFSGFDS